MARPKIKVDWDKIDNLLRAHCDGTGIASLMGMGEDTLYRICKETHKIGFDDYKRLKRSEGVELLRSTQFKVAMSGDKSMLIWLGKQYLDQKDKTDIGNNISIADDTGKKLGSIFGSIKKNKYHEG